jgi:hypothetical protein
VDFNFSQGGMKAVLSFFIRFAPIIYLLVTVGLLLGIRQLVRARAEAREANYGLEREIAHRHASQAISTLALVGFLAIAEMVLIVFLAPSLPALLQVATPTMNPLLIPTSTLSPELIGTLGAVTPGPTPTTQSTGCVPGQIEITSPKPGDEIKGQTTLIGTADIPNFGFYKYEFAAIDTNTWSAVEASRKVVRNGELGKWDTSAILQGDYQLRLVVADNQGNELPACVIQVRVKAP